MRASKPCAVRVTASAATDRIVRLPRTIVVLTLSLAVLAALLGALIAPWLGWSVLCLGLAGQLLFHGRRMQALDHWSRAPQTAAIPNGEGSWGDLFSRLARREREMQAHISRSKHEIGHLTAAVHAMNDGVVLLDDQMQIVFSNRAAERQLGLRADADRGLRIDQIVRHPEFVDYLLCGDFAQALPVRLERPARRVLSIGLTRYANDRWLLHVHDFTENERLDDMKRAFVANVSHELRTPLTVLHGFIETLGELDLEPATRQRYLALMNEQSTRMLSIIQDLLTLSAIESAPPPEDARVDMARLIEKLRRDAEALSAGRHAICVETHGEGDLRGAESELVSALANLVTNAVRYTPTGGSVTLVWKVTPQGADFSVQDTGIGIDQRHLPRLTERFYRVDRGRSREAGGTGLGLAIAKHALNRHQAMLEIASTPGQGSRFTAKFPPERVIAR